MRLSTTALLSLPLLAAAGPVSLSLNIGNDMTITPEQLEQIAPESKSCDNAPAPGQCATAAQAASVISKSFETYKVTSRAEQAAVIGIMAFESGQFKYNKPVNPTPGKGTRNMQSPTFNQQYASALNLPTAGKAPDAILDLILANEENDFGSGAWFLTATCHADVRTALQTGSEEGWEQYITQCVGTQATAERKEFWTRAMQALGVQAGTGAGARVKKC
ncbi:hypothetical protein VTN00DRAFT_8737 [Thermoascus crustaceus]|uniref:uncharacterized protein n=1 Tax=Thermoascus crustaceus TaxID=5088 RepID=UPI003742A7AB